jgi:hypothetical protein
MFVLSLHAGHTDTHKINCHFYSFFFVMKTTDFAINPFLITLDYGQAFHMCQYKVMIS